MNEFIIEKDKTCAITGHRVLEKGIDEQKIRDIFLKLIDSGKENFLCGMALGFDSLCFDILKEIRKSKNIKIIACIPCFSQDKSFNFKQKQEYKKMKEEADEKIFISKEYTPYCMMKRNMFMVDNCSVLVAYLNKNTGGTKNTVEYAKKRNVPIINV